MSDDETAPIEPPAYLNDNLAEFLQPAFPRIAAISWRRWMEPYFRLEEHELGVRLLSQRAFQQAITIWLRQLDLMIRGIAGTYELDGLTREEQQALNVRLNLLSLAISTTKLALDGMLGGHYSGSLSLCRSLLETWRRVAYVRLSTSDVWRWTPWETWPPDLLNDQKIQMPTGIPDAKDIGRRIEAEGDEGDQKILERVRSGFKYLSDHAHPSMEGASQTWSEGPETGVFSPQFSEMHATYCLKWGLFANQILLREISSLRNQSNEWMVEQEAVAISFADFLWGDQDLNTEEEATTSPVESESSERGEPA